MHACGRSGERNVVSMPPAMGSEDFHHLVIDNYKKQYFYAVVATASQHSWKFCSLMTREPGRR